MIKLESGEKFAKMIKNSQVHVIKNCGHMIILENAFEMREKILEFLKNEKFLYKQITKSKIYTFYKKIEEQVLKITQCIIICYYQLPFLILMTNIYI